MNRSRLAQACVVLVVFLVAAAVGYLFGLSQPDRHAEESSTHAEHKGDVKYTCSMHPFIIRDAPGACPICGMALTPVKDEHGSHQDSSHAGNGNEIQISPVTLQNIGVRTEKAVFRPLAKTIRAPGTVTAKDDQQYSINTKIEGWVEKLFVNQQGQRVKKGQPLMELYSPEMVVAQQEFLLALTNRQQLADSISPEIVKSADRLVEASRNRLNYWDISKEQIKTLEQTKKVKRTLTLYSNREGVVTGKKVVEGMRVMPGEELLQITDLSKVWINAEIYEYELPWLKIGQRVDVELPISGSSVLEGTISYIYPYLENETRTVKTRIELANPDQMLKPAMFVSVRIHSSQADRSLTIPESALLNSGKSQTVFVALGEGRFTPRAVQAGQRDDSGNIGILSGLKEGEEVVVSAQFMLDSESKLREALNKMLAAPDSAATGQQGSNAKSAKNAQLDELFK